MKKSRCSEEEIIGILKQGEAGVKTADVCREHGISAATFYQWKQKFGGVGCGRSAAAEAVGGREPPSEAAGGGVESAWRSAGSEKRLELAGLRGDVAFAVAEHRLSERTACKLLDVERSSYRHAPRPDWLIDERGRPENVRSDNGPEFTSRRILGWATDRKVELVHIQPGRPMQNGHVESFHGRLRGECLNTAWFRTLGDVRQKLADWQQEYNCERPHSSLDYRTPQGFKRACDESWAMAQLSSQTIHHQ